MYNDKRFQELLTEAVKGRTFSGIAINTMIFDTLVALLRLKEFVSEYQGPIDLSLAGYGRNITIKSVREYFSEGYRKYVINPNNPRAKALDPHEYIKELIR